jgi:hypothetical protein
MTWYESIAETLKYGVIGLAAVFGVCAYLLISRAISRRGDITPRQVVLIRLFVGLAFVLCVLISIVQVLSAPAQSPPGAGAVPVGTIVASFLNPAAFAKAVGDPPLDKQKQYLSADSDFPVRWRLADTQEIIGTIYSRDTGEEKLPDLRGMFLRGMNCGRDDGNEDPKGDRVVGSTQSDSLAAHVHETDAITLKRNNSHPDDMEEGHGAPDFKVSAASLEDAGGKETRPKNVAVYYYVRVN